MAREGTIKQVTAEDMARMKRQMTALRNDLSDKILCLEEDLVAKTISAEDLEGHSKIAHCRAILDEIIHYIASRDGVSQGEVSSTAITSRLWR